MGSSEITKGVMGVLGSTGTAAGTTYGIRKDIHETNEAYEYEKATVGDLLVKKDLTLIGSNEDEEWEKTRKRHKSYTFFRSYRPSLDEMEKRDKARRWCNFILKETDKTYLEEAERLCTKRITFRDRLRWNARKILDIGDFTNGTVYEKIIKEETLFSWDDKEILKNLFEELKAKDLIDNNKNTAHTDSDLNKFKNGAVYWWCLTKSYLDYSEDTHVEFREFEEFCSKRA